MDGNKHRVTRVTALLAVAAVVITAVLVVSVVPAGTVEAARQAPTAPFPECVRDEFGNGNLGCVTDDAFGAAIGGTFARNGEFTISTAPDGLAPCLTYLSTGWPGDVVPNAVLAKVGAKGQVCLYSFADTDLVVDVTGYVD